MGEGSTIVSVDDGSECTCPEWVESVLGATLKLISNPTTQKRMHSQDAARECLLDHCRFDSIFIDGCHEYAECKADIQAWLPLLNPGGIICGHDYWPAHIGVMDAVNEVFSDRYCVVPGTRIWFLRT